MADQLADSLPIAVRSGDDIIGDSLQTNQYTVTFDLRTSIIIGFSVSLFFCVVYRILCSFFCRLIDTRIYYHHGDDVDYEEGTDLTPGAGGGGDMSQSQHWVAMYHALVLSNMEAWVMVMEDSTENGDESRGDTLKAMKKLPALVKYGSEHDENNNKVTRNCENCAVCLEDFKVGEMCQIFPRCNHAFHSNCIDCWLATKLTCPICRSYITYSFRS